MKQDVPKTSLKGTDLVAAVLGPKSGPHVIVFANATQVELVAIYPYYSLDIRQRLSPTDSQEFLMSLLDVLDYDVEGMHHYSPEGHRVTRRLAARCRFSHYMGDIYLRVEIPEIHGFHRFPALSVGRTRAMQLAKELADILGWEIEL